jgi:uncharacterized membrane protein
MSAAVPQPLAWVDRGARAVARHWLAILNGFLLLYVTLPWLSPLLRSAGYERLGRLIMYGYGGLCHQLPDRSFFLGGYQVCYCHRCTALYSSIAVVGLLFGLFRWRRPLATRGLLLLTIPIVVDGVWHIADDFLPGLGLRSTMDAVGSVNFWARMVTGVLFGVGLTWWFLPRLAEALVEVEHV